MRPVSMGEIFLAHGISFPAKILLENKMLLCKTSPKIKQFS